MSEELPGMLAVAKGVAEQRWPHTMDAKVWADEFAKMNPEIDHGLMLGWFANAIMAGYDTAQARFAHSESGRVSVPRELTAENGAKGALSGEFTFWMDCCSRNVTVPWDTLKEIHRKVVELFGAHSATRAHLDFRDVVYNRGDYRADGQRLQRVRLEVVTEDGQTFWVHANDHECQERRITRAGAAK